MLIRDLITSDALPSLAASMRFASQRQRLIANNIANISTPDFRPTDVSPKKFQAALGDAIDRRRAQFGGVRGNLRFEETRDFRVGPRGRLELRPSPSGKNILFHDRNDRDLERMMQDLAENTASFRFSAMMFRSQMDLLNTAISERV